MLNTTANSELKCELANSIEKNETLELSIDLMRSASNKVKDELARSEDQVQELQREVSELRDEKDLLITQLEKTNSKFINREPIKICNSRKTIKRCRYA